MKKKILIAIVIVACLAVAAAVLLTRHNSGGSVSRVAQPSKTYTALGDSVAAGAGLATASDASACDRNDESYPKLLAQRSQDYSGYRLTDLACSGARLSAGVLQSQTVNQLALEPQLDALLSKPKPDLITMTIGANDLNWTDILRTCYTGTCGSAADGAAVSQALQTVRTGMAAALGKIKSTYGTPPATIVTGYYGVFPSAPVAGCTDMAGITQDELDWFSAQQKSLNDTLSSVASQSGFARFSAISFGSHELCTAGSWIQSLTDRQPFHPTADGQKAIADSIRKAL